jgi:hypothetical protein
LWCLSLLHHAPIRIKVVRVVHPAGEKEQGQRKSPSFWGALTCSFEPETLSGKPDQKIFGTRPCPSEAAQVSWFDQPSVAHGVGNKDAEKDWRWNRGPIRFSG